MNGFVPAKHHISKERGAAVDLHRTAQEGARAAAAGDDGVDLKRHGIQGDAGVPCPWSAKPVTTALGSPEEALR